MEFIYQILGSLLGLVYNFVHVYWLAIVVMTCIVKVILLPLSFKQIQSSKAMNEVQPKLKALQEKYKNDKETLNVKMMELYKEYNINPLAGCLPMLIQFPILIGLFGVFREPAKWVFGGDASLATEALNQGFLWVSNLGEVDTLANLFGTNISPLFNTLPGLLPIIAAFTTYLSMATMSGKQQQANQQMKTMQYMMPVMILFFGSSMAAGMMIYWTTSNLFQMAQQYIIPKMSKEGTN